MDKLRCGLLGRHLSHSFSGQIHAMLGDYEYRLIELEPEELGSFLQSGAFDGLNVTIPYKKAVLPYMDALSDAAKRIGSVNTVLCRDGRLYGYNTDYDGFRWLLQSVGAELSGKKALILGDGGVAPAIRAALSDMGAGELVTVSRRGPVDYESVYAHADASVIVNATPVGMYPKNGERLLELSRFPKLEYAFDAVYNPARTAFLLDAERRGAVCAGGLGMLAAQAVRASELFTGRTYPAGTAEKIVAALRRQTENVILTGMPGCGKSSVGACLAKLCGRAFIDTDAEIEKAAGESIPAIFARGGEELFRELEHEAICRMCAGSGAVIALGGGAVTRENNFDPIRQNGRVVWLRRELSQLPTEGRPLSKPGALAALYREREAAYGRIAELTVDNDAEIIDAAERIRKELGL